MKVQFAAFIAKTVTQEDVKRFDPKPGKEKGSVVAQVIVAESGKDKQFHKVELWGREELHQYLTQGRLIEVTGDFGYNLSESDSSNSIKYYSIKNADIQLLTSSAKKEE
ncbi:MAG: hypothetical protein RIB01_15185 [Balneola sp.]